MRFHKSHFSYSKSQRNGIYVLIILVVVVQLIVFCFKLTSDDKEIYKVDYIQKQLDSLQVLDKKNQHLSSQLKLFNPNYLSDYKAYRLGMSVKEIDRLLAFRSKGKYVNSVQDFKKVTLVSDSLLSKISPYFKFPDWVKKKKNKSFKKEKKIVVKDINTATKQDLVQVVGIGEKRAVSILKYRTLLKGFTYHKQIDEVWGIPSEVLIRLKNRFKVLSTPNIVKLNVNKISFYELKSIVYIDYKQAKRILEYKEEVAEIQNLAELKTITNFPVDKFDLISIYLQAE